MTAFPRTAVGLVSLMIFVGYLMFLVFGGNSQIPFQKNIIFAQNNIATAAKGLNSDSGTFGSITAVGTIIFNFFILIIGLFLGIFVALATFVASMTALPLVISELIISIISVGLLFALLSKVIQI